MKKVNVLGSLNMDLVTSVVHTPVVGETVIGKGLLQMPGGKGANQAAAIGKLGGAVSMIGRVGEDAFGEVLIDRLEMSGVETTHVLKTENSETGTALITVNADGDNAIVVIPGANFRLTPSDVQETALDGDYIVAQLEVPQETIAHAFRVAKQKAMITVLNPAPAATLDSDILKYCDFIIPNESEFMSLTGYDPHDEAGLEKGLTVLFEQGVGTVLITLGGDGVLLCDNAGGKMRRKAFPAQKVTPVDTTAAGDSFIGGMLYALCNGSDIEASIVFATKVAAVTVTRRGAQESLPTMAEVIERFGE
jgi:ribokinase